MSMTFERDRVSNYYNVNLGKIVKSLGKIAPENMEGVTPRTNKDGVTVYEIVASGIKGKIIGLELKQPEQGKEDYGSQIVFTLESDQGEKAVLNCKFDSAYGRGFMQALDSLDLNAPVEFEPYQYFSKQKGRDISGMSVYQFGSKIDWTYTRSNPNGMPELEEVTFKGKQAWDNSKQLDFLTAKLKEAIVIVSGNTPVPVADKAPAKDVPTDKVEDEDPF